MVRRKLTGLCGALLVGGASAFAGSASTFVLSPEFVSGKSASYESLSQDELAAGLLRFSRPGFHTGVIGGEPWEKNFLKGNGGDADLIAVVVTRGAADGLPADPAIRQVLREAETSVSFPYAQPSLTSLPSVLATQFAESHSGRPAGGLMVAGNCGKSFPEVEGAVYVSFDAVELSAALDKQLAAVEGPTLLLLCADKAEETAAVPAAVEAVRHSSAKYLIMFAPEVDEVHAHRMLGATVRRPPKPPMPPMKLTPPKAWKPPAPAPSPPPPPAPPAGSGMNGGIPDSCDDVCLAQQTLIQMSAVLLVFILMALSGSCCLSALQGPDRFEVSKDGMPSNH